MKYEPVNDLLTGSFYVSCKSLFNYLMPMPIFCGPFMCVRIWINVEADASKGYKCIEADFFHAF